MQTYAVSALEQFLSTERNNFDEIEKKAETTLPGVEYKSIHQRRTMQRQTRIDDDSVTATADRLETSSARDKFRIKSFIPVIVALRSHLSRKATVYKRDAENFSFLIDLHASREEILQRVMNFKREFLIDVDLCLVDELLNFYLYVKKAHGNIASFSHEDMYQIIKNDKVEAAFPNVETIFRLQLCMMVTTVLEKDHFLS